jgi:hypothetical protein
VRLGKLEEAVVKLDALLLVEPGDEQLVVRVSSGVCGCSLCGA